ncbi:MAG: glycosyltransferase family 2 protein [Desulfobulbus sp.]|nr:glycosyltransferase family 2 protein [Desulfobulbus sp.]
MISVVIVNWNTQELLRDCLNSLCKFQKGYEVIVIDNASIDGSVEMVKKEFPELILIQNDKNFGFCKATNQGISIAKGKFILLLNSDTVVNPTAIDEVVSFLETHEDSGIAGCKLTYPDGSFQSSCFRFPNLWGNVTTYLYLAQIFRTSYLLNWDRYGYKAYVRPVKVDCVMGSFLMIKKSVIEECGLLDEAYFMFAEETDLCYRAKKAGWSTYFIPSVSIVHNHSGSQKNWSDTAWAYGAKQRGIFLFMMKWRSPFTLFFSNSLFLFTHIPKSCGWFLADIVEYTRNRDSVLFKRFLKAKLLPFHFKALFQPSLFKTSWQK